MMIEYSSIKFITLVTSLIKLRSFVFLYKKIIYFLNFSTFWKNNVFKNILQFFSKLQKYKSTKLSVIIKEFKNNSKLLYAIVQDE